MENNPEIYSTAPIIVDQLAAAAINVNRWRLIYDLANMRVFVKTSWTITPEVAIALCRQMAGRRKYHETDD
jgi:hypothetical protein